MNRLLMALVSRMSILRTGRCYRNWNHWLQRPQNADVDAIFVCPKQYVALDNITW